MKFQEVENKSERIIDLAEKLVKVFIKNISQDTKEVLYQRGLSTKDITEMGWGTSVPLNLSNYPFILDNLRSTKFIDGTNTIIKSGLPIYPIRHYSGMITGFQIKSTTQAKYLTYNLHPTLPPVYGGHLYTKQYPYVLLTEGIFDFTSVKKCLPVSFPVLSTLTANIRYSHLAYIRRRFDNLIFLYDRGYWASESGGVLRRMLKRYKVPHSVVETPDIEGCKDWNDIHVNLGENETSVLLSKLIPHLQESL